MMTSVSVNYEGQDSKQVVSRRPRVSPLSIGILAIVLTVIFTPILLMMIKAGNDYPMHIWWAWYWDKTGLVTEPLPHFLYQVLVIVFEHILPGNSYDGAAVFVGILCYVTTGILLFVLIYPLYGAGSAHMRTLVAALTTLAVMLVGPINFLWGSTNLSFGYIPTNAYNNPTIVLLKPFALLLFLFALRTLNSTSASRITIVGCAIVTILGTIAKPNYAIAFLPAFALVVAYYLLRKRPINWPLLIIGILVPAAEILVWQLNYVRGSSLSGFVIASFQVMQLLSPNNLLPKFVLSILFPICVMAAYWQNARNDSALGLAWISFAVGAFYTYFLSETQNYSSGNFTWSGQITLFVLFAASIMFLIRQNRDVLSQRRLDWRLAASLVLLSLHLLGGIALYLAHLNPNWRSWL
ncbi:MAG: hypothetical protein GC179_07170 [Anaerolineaceae bacterium]|nr:hypothetical protein [Anaerolineaceae bacterium]